MDQNLTMHPRSLRAEGSKWFGLTCRLSSELSEVLHREQIAGRSAEILFESDKKGIIRIEGKIAFEITISDSNVVEPYKLNRQNQDLTYLGPVVGRCTIISLGTSIGIGTGAEVGASSDKKKPNKLDMQAFKLLTAESSSRKRPPTHRQPISGGIGAESSLSKRAKTKTRKLKVKSSAGPQRSSVVLCDVPLTASSGQVESFFSGLNVIDIFSVPKSVKIVDIGANKIEGVTDVYVNFGSNLSADLAEKRSGEELRGHSAVNPIVKVVDEVDWNMSKGMGLNLRLNAKSMTTASKLASLLVLSQSVFCNPADQETFRRILLQRDSFPDVVHIRSNLDKIIWNSETAYDPLLVESLAVLSIRQQKKGPKRGLSIKRNVNSGNLVDDSVKCRQTERVPSSWNALRIAEAILPASHTGAVGVACTVQTLLKQLRHLQAIYLISNTELEEICAVDGTIQVKANHQKKEHADFAEMLQRMHHWYASLQCIFWRRDVIESHF